MPNFERSGIVDGPPDDVFSYLADVRHLPSYAATMSEAVPLGGDRVRVAADVEGRHEVGEARFVADRSRRRLEWGGSPDHGYHGWLQVQAADGADHSRVTVHLSTQRTDVSGLTEVALDRTLDNISRLAAAR